MSQKNMRFGVLLALLNFAVSTAAPVYETMPTGSLVYLDMTLQKVLSATTNVRLVVQTVGNKVTALTFEGGLLGYREWEGITLSYANGVLSGAQRVKESSGGNVLWDYKMEIAATVSGGQLSGTYKLLRSKAVSLSNGQVTTSLQDMSGTLAGTARTESEYTTKNAIDPALSWDSYQGSNQNFYGTSTGTPLVSDLGQTKMLWSSEFIGSMQIGDCRHKCRMGSPLCAGGSSPFIYKGKVFQAYHQPIGTQIQKCFLDAMTDTTRGIIRNSGLSQETVMRRFNVQADEYMIALDAATGKTLWRTRFPGEGINLVGHKTAFANHTGCAGGDLVYMFGELGIIRALDPDNGTVKWTANIPGYYETQRKLLDDGIATGTLSSRDRAYAHCINYIGGVVVAPTGILNCGAVGFDGQTGAKLWTAGSLGEYVNPLRWTKDGKEYVICVGKTGTVTCLKPADGSVMWTQAGAPDTNQHPVTLENDYLLTVGGCYKLSLTGAQKLWSNTCRFNSRSAGIIRSGLAYIRCNDRLEIREAATGKVLRSDPTLGVIAEAYTLGMEGYIFVNVEAQHHASYDFKLYKADPTNWIRQGSWRPTVEYDLTYATPPVPPLVQGRIFVRGAYGISCYDARKESMLPTSTSDAQTRQHSAKARRAAYQPVIGLRNLPAGASVYDVRGRVVRSDDGCFAGQTNSVRIVKAVR